MFQTLVENDLVRPNKKVESYCRFTNNILTKTERAAIKTLKSQAYLVIRQVDKGGAVILNSEDYRLLSDTTTYRTLRNNPTL